MKKVLDFFKNIGRKIKSAWNKSAPARGKIAAFCSATGKWTYKLRGLVLAIPIVAISILAVFIPLLVTSACLLFMFLSKRISFPFLVSVFSLVLPIFFSVAAKLPS